MKVRKEFSIRNLSRARASVVLLTALLTALALLAAPSAPVASAHFQTIPVEQMLNPDGTLNLTTGFQGNLELTGWDVTMDNARGVRLTRQREPAPRARVGNAPIGGFRNMSEEVAGTWSALGTTPLNGRVRAIAISASGAVYAGGDFTDAGGDAYANHIAVFTGGTWTPVGTGLVGGSNQGVYAIAISGSGDVYAGGRFTATGAGAEVKYIAKFSGGDWSPLGTGLSGPVNAIGISGSTVYAGGSFSNAGGDGNARGIAKFDGETETWSAVGTGLNGTGTVNAIAISGSTVYAGGTFTDAGGNANRDFFATFSGGDWSGPGVGDPVLAIAISEGDVYVGRDITPPYCLGGANPPPCPFFGQDIFKFSDGNLSTIGTTLVGHVDVNAIAISESGDLYIGGRFSDAGGEANADGIAILRSGSWSALGSVYLTNGVNSYAIVRAIAIRGNDAYAGGDFTNAGNDPYANYIAKFTIPAGYGSSLAPGSTLDFGVTTVGTAVTRNLTVSETGDGQLDVATAGISGDLTLTVGAFSITAGAPPFSIANGGASRSITLQCLSSTVGVKTAILTLTHNGVGSIGSPVSYPLSCKVNRANTTTQIVSDNPDASVVGQSYVVSYTVTSTGGTPTGDVTVTDGTGNCGGILSELGSGTCTLTSTSAGNKTLTATYSGNTNFNGSQGPASHTVERANTTTTITSDNPDPSRVGESVVVNYAVTVREPGSGTPTGTVTVRDANNPMVSCTGTAVGGTCTLTWTALTSVGTKSVLVRYLGDNNFNSSSRFTPHTVRLLPVPP